MTELKPVVALAAQLVEFLVQQDEATLQALASGTARLAVVDAVGAPAAAQPVVPPAQPLSEPERLLLELSTLTTEGERRSCLLAGNPSKKTMQEVAKSLRLRRYSHLTIAKLVDLLARHGVVQAETSAGETEHRPVRQEPAPPAEPQKSPAEIAAIVVRLREADNDEEGAEYLRAQQLDRASLLAVATALQLTRVERLSRTDLEKKVLNQAVGARRKFAGLRSW
ncbi:hypothetical protein AB0F91_11295 [Amycolatopsis sp. NPDC023774]|uniref:hypothetical protein n=1 Tax=Amycolatopsis sp. NPDC023774 TaxID=3155015 RepID=UPI0033DA0C16